jgi:hypothetical protein
MNMGDIWGIEWTMAIITGNDLDRERPAGG